MGYFVGLPLGGAAEKDCQVRFGKNMTFQVETRAPPTCLPNGLCKAAYSLHGPMRVQTGPICWTKCRNVL